MPQLRKIPRDEIRREGEGEPAAPDARSVPFSALLRRRRLAAGLTQQELAERSTVSTRAISELERDINRRPQRETLRLLADGLALSGEERDRFVTVARRRVSTAMAL